ncbi:TetR family transcriptional regulator [Phenylobacterium sp. LjRoot219]|uniref:TetR/AcrR family transcriptional regulator n=1 Tax=Phenylobacterium sp. LjRoot219 TaxID=3342283 RepID=UPI003ED11F25
MSSRPSAARAAASSTKTPEVGEAASRAERLVAAAALQISEHGLAAASARSVAATAGASASAINYNFGGIERLLSLAFEQGTARTAAWLEARRQELDALPRTPDGAVRALEHVVREWTLGARPLALLYQERRAVAPAHGGGPWTALWRDFWLATADDFGLDAAQGRLMQLFFESEGLYHLSAWSPALEGAVLRELADHFGAVWLGASPMPAIGALAQAERSAGALTYGTLTPAAARIAVAAAATAEAGLGGLTHRAVAARAGVTTGAVTHHFRTIEELTAGAIRGQVLALTPPDGEAGTRSVEDSRSREEFIATIRPHTLRDGPAGPALARRNLFLAAVRRPEQAACAAVIRFAHGGTTRRGLQGLLDLPPEVLSLRAAVLSRLLSAIWYATAADPAPVETRARLFEAISARAFVPEAG